MAEKRTIKSRTGRRVEGLGEFLGWSYEWDNGKFGANLDGGGGPALEFDTREEAESNIREFVAMIAQEDTFTVTDVAEV